MPIVREADGLAMSSRNVRLRGDERTRALAIYRGLSWAQEGIKAGVITEAAQVTCRALPPLSRCRCVCQC